jgi:hypothetical protein
LAAKKSGLKEIKNFEYDLKTGKKFFVGCFRKDNQYSYLPIYDFDYQFQS